MHDPHEPTVWDGGFSYRDVYESMPVSIWVEDWSAAKTYTDDLKRRGVGDIWAYFIDHPEQLKDLASLVEVLDVNWTAVTLYRAPSKQALIDTTWGETMSDNELSAFRDQVTAFASGKTAVMTEDQESRFDGKPLWIRNRAVIHPRHLEDWSLVIFAASDISESMVVGKALGGDLERLSDVLSNVPCALYRRHRDLPLYQRPSPPAARFWAGYRGSRPDQRGCRLGGGQSSRRRQPMGRRVAPFDRLSHRARYRIPHRRSGGPGGMDQKHRHPETGRCGRNHLGRGDDRRGRLNRRLKTRECALIVGLSSYFNTVSLVWQIRSMN